MTVIPATEEIAALPGPTRFVDRVADDLNAGKSVIVVFPDSLVDEGIADVVLYNLGREGVGTTSCYESTEPFPERVLITFGADPRRDTNFADWDTIADWGPWHGSWVVIRGWVHDDAEEVVDRWPPQLTACGLSMEDRPKLIVGARLGDLSRKKIAHVDRSGVAVHWWWGVFDRIDTELRLALSSDRPLNPVESAVIVEVAGWELRCVDFLVGDWDGTTAGLQESLNRYRSRVIEPSNIPEMGHGRRLITEPPAHLEQAWRNGLVDRWSYGIRSAVDILNDVDVTQRLWMAHNRVLGQYVDEERAEYERMILSKTSRRSLEGLRIRDDDIIEIGSLAWLVDTRRVDIGKSHRERLQTFRDVRNDLAHRRPVTDELMRRVTAYLEF
ncbi:MAG: hypothetical protein AB1925_22315 [Actinomycetota bacterium]